MGIPFLTHTPIHGICPFGGVVSLYQFLTSGSLIRMVHQSAMILMLAVFLLTILFGPAFCGWICPFGTVQELFSKIGRKVLGKRFNVFPGGKKTERIDFALRFLRYIILALVVINTARLGRLVFEKYDPYFALFHLFKDEAAISSFIVLGFVLALSLVMERPFCKYICPYGALLGLFNLFSVFRPVRKEEGCTKCGLCNAKCPMNIKVSEKKSVRNHQCISCLECTSEKICPVPDTVNFAAGNYRRPK